MGTSTELRLTRLFYVASFLLSTAILALLALSQPLRSNIAASFAWGVLLVIGTMIIGRLTGTRRKYLNLFLLAAVLNLVIVPPEAYLRVRGFRYDSGIQFGYPRPHQFSAFEPDAKLFWRFPQSEPGVNSFGFREREVTVPKPAGTFRIMFLGNSCTYQGFPRMIELILRTDHPGVECLNFATPGYTSYQGRVIARAYLDMVEPDLVVASYGWNDRWLAYGQVDEEKTVTASTSRATDALRGVYSQWRLLQFLYKSFTPKGRREEPLDVSRVPIDQFRGNLRTIASECAGRGIPVIFATEPTSHFVLGVPDFVTESNYAASKEASLALVRKYNDAVREIAGEGEDRHLIDLDALISRRSDVRDIFTGDGLHYSQSGLALVAEIESRFITGHFLEGTGSGGDR